MALAVMMFVSVPLVLMLQWLSKAVYAHEYLIQDQMSILQLRFYISQCESWQLFDNEIHVVFEKKEYQLQFHQKRLVKRPGYEIFMHQIEQGEFMVKGEKLYLEWHREERAWRAELTS